jgi:transposase
MICAAVERCAGIDVGKTFLAVCVMTGPLDGEARTQKRHVGTIMAELEALRDWLKQEGVTHVVMESTGSYWKPVFNVLEESFHVYLANPQEVKNRKGHKTDDKDGWWLAHLLRHAMIHPSFIPPRPLRELRDLTRRRKRLLSNASAEKNRIQKVLEDANVKLGSVLSDVFGVSGQLMLEALLGGKAQPADIAQCAKRRAQRKIPEIRQALEGHQMSDHHRQMIRYSLKHLEFLEEQIGDLDLAIASQIKAAGLLQQWELLQTLPGIQERSAATILAETGGNMEQFPTPKISVRGRECVRETTAAPGRIRAATRPAAILGCATR